MVVYANDTAGNMRASSTVYFTVDTTSPTISVLSPENKTNAITDVSLIFTVSESTSWIGYSLDGQANITIAGNTTLTGLSDGMHSLVVYASDIAGNIGSSHMVYSSKYLNCVTREQNLYTTDIPLTFTVDEPTSLIGYSLDGELDVTISGDTTLSGLSDSLHSLIVYAVAAIVTGGESRRKLIRCER